MSFYLYDEPLRLYLHYTIRWVLKTYNLYSWAAFLWSRLHEQSLPAIILLFLGQLSQRGGTDILDRIFFSSKVVAVEFSWNQWGKSPFFLWNVIGFRLPAFGSHVYYLVLMHSDPLTVPPAETEYHIVVYHITPSSATANTTATTLYTVATMAINIMLYSGIQRLCVLTRAMGSCMVNNCMASAMKYISDQVLVIRSVKSPSSCISLKRYSFAVSLQTTIEEKMTELWAVAISLY